MLQRLAVKLIITFGIAFIYLYAFTDATGWQNVLSTLAFTLLAFFVGDQIILRGGSNTVAVVSDALMAFIYFWVVSRMLGWDLSMTELLGLTVLLGITEYYFHRLLRRWDREGVR